MVTGVLVVHTGVSSTHEVYCTTKSKGEGAALHFFRAARRYFTLHSVEIALILDGANFGVRQHQFSQHSHRLCRSHCFRGCWNSVLQEYTQSIRWYCS